MTEGGAIGIIGGSGLYALPGLTRIRWRRVRTPFGDPSDEYCTGQLGGRPVVFLPRHGRGHRLMPSELNFRANIWGLKRLGVERVISVSAVGSMREEIRPLDLVIPDQFFDHTRRRVSTFFGDGIVAHLGMAEPVCGRVAEALEKAGRETGATVHRGGTYICIEGPQFSSKAESRVYRKWGVDVIGMTNMPEAKLAREAELCYATLALVTDYDVWHDTHAHVSVEAVVQNLQRNVTTAQEVIERVVPVLPSARTCDCPTLLKNAVITDPSAFPAAARKRLDLLIAKYFSAPRTRPTAIRRTSRAGTRDRTPRGPRRAARHGTAGAPLDSPARPRRG